MEFATIEHRITKRDESFTISVLKKSAAHQFYTVAQRHEEISP
jgi:hypothetical protein